jgi:hypothetical protein
VRWAAGILSGSASRLSGTAVNQWGWPVQKILRCFMIVCLSHVAQAMRSWAAEFLSGGVCLSGTAVNQTQAGPKYSKWRSLLCLSHAEVEAGRALAAGIWTCSRLSRNCSKSAPGQSKIFEALLRDCARPTRQLQDCVRVMGFGMGFFALSRNCSQSPGRAESV